MKKNLILLFVVAVACEANYCNLRSCQGEPHTMCIYTPKNKCNRLTSSGLTKAEKDAIVKLHNDLRQKVKLGKESRGAPGPQPAAKYMKNLVWDEEISNIAQRWADQCKNKHDKCRNTKNGWIGQNIAYYSNTKKMDSIKLIKHLVQMWYDEVALVNRRLIDQSYGLGHFNYYGVGHYTQMVWADTDKIGCGAVRYQQNKNNLAYNAINLICNYGPGGNMRGEKIYQTVTSASGKSFLKKP